MKNASATLRRRGIECVPQAVTEEIESQHEGCDREAGEDRQMWSVEQVCAPVRWEDSIRYLLGEGFTRFIELGPGTVLSGFLKRIDKAAQTLHVGDASSLEATVAALA